MPKQDNRAKAIATNGQHKTSGAMTVSYRDVNGHTRNAVVLGGGTASGLKLDVPGRGVVDNVPLATTMKSTNAYMSRSQ